MLATTSKLNAAAIIFDTIALNRVFLDVKIFTALSHNASLRGKKLLAKISDEGAKANCCVSR
jgi:hypothetical protein|tara:strand:+ start:429 stop:614 length:186 start_codon:yes stop_codon:yes gene_type:complete